MTAADAPVSPGGPALHGRAGDLAAVRAILDGAAAGATHLLLVSGEPGIGKTALTEAAAAQARARGFRVVRGRCWEGADPPAHWLWRQVLRGLRDEDQEPEGTAGPRSPAAMADQVAAALTAAASAAPLLLVLDDVHNGSAGAIRTLPLIAARLRGAAVAVLVTFRDGVVTGEDVREVLQHLVAQHPHRRLRGLEPDALHGALVGQGVPVPAHRLLRLHTATAGNPLLATLLARAPGGAGDDLVAEDPPEELRAHVRRRVSALPGSCRRLLDVIAVLAAKTSVGDAAAVADIAVEAMRTGLLPALEDGLLEEDGDVLRLRHPVVRACLYADLPLDRRVALHRTAAAVLAPRAGEDPGARSQIAHHVFHAAGGVSDPAVLLPGLLAGVVDARAARDHREAASLLGHALACAEAAGAAAATRVDILLALGSAQERSARPAAADRSWRAALAVARLSGDRILLGRAAVASARSSLYLDLATSTHVRALEEALAALGEEESPLRAEVLGLLSTALQRTHERLRGRSLAEEAVLVAERTGDPGARAVALLARHEVVRGGEAGEQRAGIAAVAARCADRAGDDDLSVLTRSMLVVDHRLRGDGRAANAAIRALRRFSVDHRHPIGCWAADVHGLVSAVLDGDQERRLSLEAALAPATRDARHLEILTDFAATMTHVGVLDDGARARVRAHARRLPHVLAWRSRAVLDAAQRGEDTAAAELDALLGAIAGRARTNVHWLLATALAAEAAATLGDAGRARVLTAHLVDRADAMVVSGRVGACRGSLRHHLGLLALTAGDVTAAVGHLREAARVHARPGFAAHRERTAAALARAEAAMRTTAPLSLVRDGAYWSLHGGGRLVTLPDLKGVRYLSRVVATPHVEIPALDLFRSDGVPAAGSACDLDLHLDGGGADPMLDADAKRSYRRQLDALAEERRRADLLGDGARVAALDREQAAITAELARSTGLGGRDRRLPSELERARTSVTKALRTAVERIREVDPGLAAHLDDALRTGARCRYAPDGPPQLIC